jgi:glycerol kinase
MKRILAIDAGTTSVRAAILDEKLQILAMRSQSLQQYYPEAGWVEHDADEIWQKVLLVCREVIAQLHLNPQEINGIGITNQRETTIIWERDSGAPIYKAIVWQDRRTANFCKELEAKNIGLCIQEKTGLRLDPYFSASKIAWILDNVPKAREKAAENKLAFGTVDSFLLWKLTGGKVHATDVTNASRTSLFNLNTLQWDQELLDIFSVPKNMLPNILPCDANFGLTEKSLFSTEIPICGIAGDQHAAAIGQALFSPGMIKSTYGTGCFMLVNTGCNIILSKNKLLTTLAYQIRNTVHYALEGSIFNAGSVVKWLRDKAEWIHQPNETETYARSVESNSGVYFVPAFTGMGAPYWQPDTRAAIVGLTLDTGKPDIIRAALEAVCYQSQDLLMAIKADYHYPLEILRVDGGMTANTWMMQFLSDILNLPVQRLANVESTVIGAGILAALGCGIFSDINEVIKNWHFQDEFKPAMPETERSRLYQGWQKAVKSILNK